MLFANDNIKQEIIRNQESRGWKKSFLEEVHRIQGQHKKANLIPIYLQ